MKKIIILILLFFCAGCTNIKYNLSIEKEKISESINVYDKNSISHDNDDDIYIGDMSAFEFFFQSLPYDCTGNGMGNYSAIKKYSSINNFFDESVVFSKFVDMDYININKSHIKVDIETDDLMRKAFSEYGIKSLSISLYIPYYVRNHNADSVNNNVYTWDFNDINNANLKIDFDMSKSYKYKKTLITIVVVSCFCVIIVGVIIYFVKRNKEVNEI